MTKRRKQWTPFERAYVPPEDINKVRQNLKSVGIEDEAIVMREFKRLNEGRIYRNNKYQVMIDEHPPIAGWPKMLHLSIKRIDKNPVRDWRDFQRIKNELIGPENEAVELYPRESRLVDTANQYHLWVIADPEQMFPFGYMEREVTDKSPDGGKQRKRSKKS